MYPPSTSTMSVHVKEETGEPGLQIVLKPDQQIYLTYTMHLHVQGTSLPSNKKIKKAIQTGSAPLPENVMTSASSPDRHDSSEMASFGALCWVTTSYIPY